MARFGTSPRHLSDCSSLGLMPPSPTPTFTRPALSPGILGAIALFVGLMLLESDAYLFVRFAVCILTIIVAVFTVQSGQWWWLAGLVPIAVVWNPAWVFELSGQWWVAAQYGAALFLVACGVRVKVSRST